MPETVSGEMLLAVDVENLELQRRTLDMALKAKGMYAAHRLVFPDKHGDPQDLGTLSNIDAAARLLFLLGKAKKRNETAQEQAEVGAGSRGQGAGVEV